MAKESGRLRSAENAEAHTTTLARKSAAVDRVAFVERMQQAAAAAARAKDRDPARIADVYAKIVDRCLDFTRGAEHVELPYRQAVLDLCLGWIVLRQAAGAHDADTAMQLLTWAGDDAGGLCDGLLCDAVEVLDRPGRDALALTIRTRFDSPAADESSGDGFPPLREVGRRQRWSAALRVLYRAQGDVAGYISIAEATDTTVRDCHAIGTMLARGGRAESALQWVARGLALDRLSGHASLAGCELAKLERRMLAELGRADEACMSAWTAYRASPSKYAYDELMSFVPERGRRLWHRWAVVAARGAEVNAGIELLLETREFECLAAFVLDRHFPSLEPTSGYFTVKAAATLEGSRPAAAARLWAWQAMQIVDAARSEHHDLALRYFKRARRSFECCGEAGDWDRTVEFVRRRFARHERFMTEFERIVEASADPSNPLCCV